MERIYETIRKYGMIQPGMHVLAGVSGGADSVCLLAALARFRPQLSFSLTVVHVEHGIRGAESLADAAYVETLCSALCVKCITVHRDVMRIAKERSMTVEEAGRAVRYETFEQLRREQNADRIAVAHNQNDQAETVLWNLVRGSGLTGLGGIRPVRDRIIRPLLFLERTEIEAILERQGIEWREDGTNLETEYTRNRLRLQILPEMEQSLNAQSIRHIAQAASQLQKVQQYVGRETDRASQRCIRREERPGQRRSVLLLLPRYFAEDPLIQEELLRRCLSLAGDGAGLRNVGRVHLAALQRLTGLPCGRESHLPGGLRAVREDGIVRFYRTGNVPDSGCGCAAVGGAVSSGEEAESSGEAASSGGEAVSSGEEAESSGEAASSGGKAASSGGEAASSGEEAESFREVILPVTLSETPVSLSLPDCTAYVTLLPNSEELWQEIHQEKKYTKCLSYDTIYGNVCFRTRRAGDYLVINEDGGRRKLKDYLIDQKIPRDRRDRMLLLADGSHILWVVGWRISEAAKVKQVTKKVLKIHLEEDIANEGKG